MTPAAIIERAASDGVTLSISTAGSIKASGDQGAVRRWLQTIRDNKPGILDVLTVAANNADGLANHDEGLTPAAAGVSASPADPRAEHRRVKALAMLAANPGARLAVVAQAGNDPVTVAVAIRDVGYGEIEISAASYDPLVLLAMMDESNTEPPTVH